MSAASDLAAIRKKQQALESEKAKVLAEIGVRKQNIEEAMGDLKALGFGTIAEAEAEVSRLESVVSTELEELESLLS